MSKDDKPDAWMPLYIGDWDGDTGHLSCEEDGAYGRLIRHYWRNGPLPDIDRILSSITRTDSRTWKRLRAALAPFFVVANGQWTHKRVDAELVRWAEKRRKAIDRASAGGKAKAAKSSASSSATSTSQAVLKHCTSASSREVEGPTGHSTLSAPSEFLGPKEVRAAFVSAKGEEWSVSYIDRCGWQDLPSRSLLAANAYALSQIDEALRILVRDRNPDIAGLTVIAKDRAA